MGLVHVFSTGLIGAIAWLILGLLPWPVTDSRVVTPASTSSSRATSTTPAAILDVAPGVTDVASIVRLAPGERVTSVGAEPVASDLAAGAAIAALPRGPGRYVDLTVARGDAERRVIVLLH